MIRDTLEFFRKEKIYAVLLLILVGAYTALYALAPAERHPSAEARPDALERFQQAESRLMENLERADSLEDYLRENPEAALRFQIVFLMIAGIVLTGCFFLFGFLFNPRWRERLEQKLDEPERARWRFSMLFKAIILFMFFSLGLNVALGLLRRFVFDWIPANFLVLFHTTLIDIFALGLLFYLVYKAGGGWKDLGFRLPSGKPWKEVGLGMAGYAAVFPVFMLILMILVLLVQLFAYQPPAHPLVHILVEEEERGGFFLIVYSVILATIIAPFVEEVFFRGFCYPVLKQRFGMWPGMIISSLIFSAIHKNIFAFIPIFVLGMALAYVYEKRKSLIAPVVLHLLHNSLFILYFFLAKNLILGSA